LRAIIPDSAFEGGTVWHALCRLKENANYYR